MLSLAERIKADKIRLTFKYVDYQTTDNWPHHLYRVTLFRRGRQWTLDYRMGSGRTDDPTALMVLHSIISDTAGYLNCSGFLDWADEYGYEIQDPDIRSKAHKIYNAIKAQTERADKFFRSDLMRYVNETDWQI